MAAYIVTQIEITDPETFETYRAQVPPILEKYGGEFIVRGVGFGAKLKDQKRFHGAGLSRAGPGRLSRIRSRAGKKKPRREGRGCVMKYGSSQMASLGKGGSNDPLPGP